METCWLAFYSRI